MFSMSDPVAFGLMIWLSAGFFVGAAFLLYGMDKVDEAARGAYAVRPLLLPGIMLIWPVVLWRWAVLLRKGA